MKKVLIYFIAIGLCSSTNAAVNGLSIHSRANCVNNESITWDWTTYWTLATQSTHYKGLKNSHIVKTGWQKTWRSAAVHYGEGMGGWKVVGNHWILYSNGQSWYLGDETVTDCSIYNGWWDRDK